MSQHSTAYSAAREGAAIIDRSDRGRIAVTGADRASYLQGLLTNDITALTAGAGCYAAYLTAQGRMIADMWVYEIGDVIILNMVGDVTATILAKLDQFIFGEDVQLGDVTDTFAQLAVVGPDSARAVAAVIGASTSALQGLGEHSNLRVDHAGSPIIVARVTDTGEPGFDLFIERDRFEAIRTALREAGAVDADPETAEALRVEAGIPLFHRDMDEETIPLEAGIESRAISFTKGCYVGQEVIIRVLHRGHGRVARRLVGLTIDSQPVPLPGATVRSGDKDVGAITSAVLSPALGRPIALGYVQRDFVEPGTALAIDGATATVTTVPFVVSPVSETR
jgi:folate-binding protein YgfZ